jgi:hypothetical protein
MQLPEHIQTVAATDCTSSCVCISRRYRHICRCLDAVAVSESLLVLCASATECRHGAALHGSRGNHWRVCCTLSTVSLVSRGGGVVNQNVNGRGQCVAAITMHGTATGQSWTALLIDKLIWTVSRSRCAVEQWPVCAAGVHDGVAISCVSPNTAHPPCCQLAEAVALSRPPFTVKAVSLITVQL